ncbi:hypothetical protein VTN49DRAFT_2495 [Thermomyces lanuginosus]|uniref:uncharacterized protein n=1 Tax=Thermomyces lanuginosus TaxID=5541 RepID=UPI00374271D5
MFRNVPRLISSACHTTTKSRAIQSHTKRFFHEATAELVNRDAKGNLVEKKVPIIIGNSDEAYILIDPGHFGFGSSTSYPRLYIPGQLPRQGDGNISPATMFLSGKMQEIALDGTFDAWFAEQASLSAKRLERVLEQLRDM